MSGSRKVAYFGAWILLNFGRKCRGNTLSLSVGLEDLEELITTPSGYSRARPTLASKFGAATRIPRILLFLLSVAVYTLLYTDCKKLW